jgi:hypothetical protein
MVGVAARRVVTGVTYIELVGDGPVYDYPDETMSGNPAAAVLPLA